MLLSFFSKGQKTEKDTFVIPQYPSYAAIYERDLKINLEEYFSGKLDDKLAIVKLFATTKEALEYLLSRPTHGSYLICLDQDLAHMAQVKEDRKGFGSHIVKAIEMSSYVMSTWEHNPLSPEKVVVIDNPYITYNSSQTT